MKIGIISDTHGLLREKIIQAFKGCQLIFHAGDIGSQNILDVLERVAPVVAVKGNNDRTDWADHLPSEIWHKINGKCIYMIHDLKACKQVFDRDKADIVISGHSHIYKEETRDNILYLNPGGAGPKRFGRAATAMVLELESQSIQVKKVLV
jgi:putative phosphoesterase